MLIFEFIKDIILSLPDFIREHPVLFSLYTLFVVGFVVINFVVRLDSIRQQKKPLRKGIAVVRQLLQGLTICIIGLVFALADEAYDFDGNLFANRFYIEVIIAVAAFSAFLVLLAGIVKKLNDDIEESMAKPIGEFIGKGIIVIIGCAIFIFTGLEEKLVDFGFSLFGKTLGEWILNIFFAAVAGELFSIAAEVLQAPFVLLFGAPIDPEEILGEE
ncbi:MAG: hypothetical protein LBQ80_04750 [Clostridium sp.]|jgi:hypothetical protein|nr:hypothetical protein [Clostridium sp.]